jgi:hypothetical protein
MVQSVVGIPILPIRPIAVQNFVNSVRSLVGSRDEDLTPLRDYVE